MRWGLAGGCSSCRVSVDGHPSRPPPVDVEDGQEGPLAAHPRVEGCRGPSSGGAPGGTRRVPRCDWGGDHSLQLTLGEKIAGASARHSCQTRIPTGASEPKPGRSKHCVSVPGVPPGSSHPWDRLVPPGGRGRGPRQMPPWSRAGRRGERG